MNYLPVYVLASTDGVDCTNRGISVTHGDKLVVPCEDGHISEADVAECGLVVLELRSKPFATATDAFRAVGEVRWTMMGGNFVYTTDSRFSRKYGGYPIALHDRIEE